MLTDLQRQKLGIRFDRLDVDGNGYIEQTDYDTIAQRLDDAIGAKNPEARQKLRDLYQRLWARLSAKMDTDHDGRISREEFIEAVGRSITERGRAGYDRWIKPISDAYLQALDVDSDGELGEREFGVIFHSTGVPEDQRAQALERLDADRSGRLSAEEFQEAIFGFYCSDDPDAPGNWLFGQIRIPRQSRESREEAAVPDSATTG